MNFNMKFVGLGFLLMLCGLMPAQEMNCDSLACDKCICCASIDPTPAGQMISHVHAKNEWMVSIRSMNNTMNELQNGTQSDMIARYGYSDDYMQMNMYMLMAMYGVSNRLTLMLMGSYNTNYMEMSMPMGNNFHQHSMQTQGIGDTKLTALYAISKKPTYHILASLGLSLPSGNINLKGKSTDVMYANTRYPFEMQTGTGSFELLPGICYLVKHNKLTYSAQMASVIRLNKNSVGYKYGNEAGLNTWLAYQLFPFMSSSFRVEAIVLGTSKGYDPNNSGIDDIATLSNGYNGERVNTYLGINLRAKKGAFNKLTLGFEYGLPVYQNLSGTQLKTKQFVNANLAFRF